MERIDRFNYEDHNPFSIKINEETKHIWDIDPTDPKWSCKRVYNHNGTKTFMIRTDADKTDETVVHYLDKLDELVYLIKIKLCKKAGVHCGKEILVITPHTLGEMPLNDGFDGLNLPKRIVKLNPSDGLKFSKDSNIRAGHRHVLLTLRKKTGDIHPLAKIMKLIIHELAHTMCNHVTFRDKGNHLKDFDDNERYLKKFIKGNPIIPQFIQDNFK